jgi:S-formylglutathione hydrolase
VDIGTADMLFETFEDGSDAKIRQFSDLALKSGIPLEFRYQDGYEHSHNFIKTFMEDHIEFHARYLNQQ